MITVKVVGCGGYGGVGIVELLLRHPETKIQTLVAATETGLPMGELYPHLKGFCDLPILTPDDPAAREPADVVFFSTPDRVGMAQAPAELKQGARVIDYSGDFRFTTEAVYGEYAQRIGLDPVHLAPDCLPQTVYGLPELNRAAYASDQRLVGNPGCFAVSCLLGLAPAIAAKLVDVSSVICDCKTGVSGAGKKATPIHHYPARYDNMQAYRLSGHQHVMEIEMMLSHLAGESVPVTFTAQVVPVCRGILSTLYGTLRDGIDAAQVWDAFADYYRDQPFVRLYDRQATVGTAHVRGSNFCNLIVDVDERTRRLRVISHIDNLMKGQAGNALQNMNLICGLPETMGLDHPGAYP
ncbi:MAG: N-acetyl-gamma-glutamyl-phosphate reductase [Kiritimatiellae bacterium]|jgi:N-acetyl-gamma-glutamyl-phosphate reductase|nr:N-acetyl-gamma-glutamyl-phosphate reductase [Kiritimatiellia bacterium]MDY0149437.1 N-acetyl-gamma-glutamyl-phosphate reductase [Kiritimatiellia bacterium]